MLCGGLAVQKSQILVAVPPSMAHLLFDSWKSINGFCHFCEVHIIIIGNLTSSFMPGPKVWLQLAGILVTVLP